MSRSQSLQEEQERALEAREEIVQALRLSTDTREISQTVAERYGVDDRKAYRWVMYTEQEYERNRRRIAVGGLILLWVGIILLVAGVTLGVFGVTAPFPQPIRLGLIVGLPLAFPGAVLAALARRLAR